MESVLRQEERLWWERSVKEVGFEARVKSQRVMDDASGELTAV